MKKIFVFAALAGSALLAGCASPQHGAIPVVDSGTPVSNQESGGFRITRTQVPRTQQGAATQGIPQGGDSGVVVMVPQGANSAPIQTFPAQSAPRRSAALRSAPAPSTRLRPAAPPRHRWATATTCRPARQSFRAHRHSGLRLGRQPGSRRTVGRAGPGDAHNRPATAGQRRPEQCRRQPRASPAHRSARASGALSPGPGAPGPGRCGSGRAGRAPWLELRQWPATLQAGLWELIAQAREKQGDSAGAALARQKAKVSS